MRNEINQERRSDKNKCYATKFSKLKDSTNIWDLFNQITNFRNKPNLMVSKLVSGEGAIIDDKQKIAGMFASEYIISSSSSDVTELHEVVSQYENDYVYEDEYGESLSTIVSKAENAESISRVQKCRPDNESVPKKIFKLFIEELLTPLHILFTSILLTCVIPKSMKVVDCYPLYKGKGKLTQASSYRAIFNLSCFMKIFERFLYNRILTHCFPKFIDAQHGFRCGRSCVTASAQFTQDVYQILDKRNGKGLAIYIDFKKAFDSVNRKILLEKLMKFF